MVRVRPEQIVEQLSQDFRKALTDAVNEVIPGTQFDEYELFRAFKRALKKKCPAWEQVSDSCVEKR